MNEKSPVLLFCQTAALPELVTTTRSQSLCRRGQKVSGEVSGEVMIGHLSQVRVSRRSRGLGSCTELKSEHLELQM